jgi:hypothetical protein
MRLTVPRATPIRIREWESLERLENIFTSNFGHIDREKYDTFSECPGIFVPEVAEIQGAPINRGRFFRPGISCEISIKFGVLYGMTFRINERG